MKYPLSTRFPVLGMLAVSLLGGVVCTGSADEVSKLKGITVTAERQLSVERPTGLIDRELRVKAMVEYTDLDLGTDTDRKELEARVTRAASDVCTELDKILPARTMEHGNCVRQSVERAMASIKNP